MTHIADINPEGDWFHVTCPEGCNLGTSAYQPTRELAEQRVRVHELATYDARIPAHYIEGVLVHEAEASE